MPNIALDLSEIKLVKLTCEGFGYVKVHKYTYKGILAMEAKNLVVPVNVIVEAEIV